MRGPRCTKFEDASRHSQFGQDQITTRSQTLFRYCEYARRGHKEHFDVSPFQSEQLALPQAGGHCKESPRSLSNAQFVYQCLDFTGRQDDWYSPPLCTLTNEIDQIAVEELISVGVIEENGHHISDFGTTALR